MKLDYKGCITELFIIYEQYITPRVLVKKQHNAMQLINLLNL